MLHIVSEIFLMKFFSTGKCLLARPTFAKEGVGKGSQIKRTVVRKASCLTTHQAGTFLFYLVLKYMRKFWILRKCKGLQLFLIKSVFIFLKMQMFLNHRKISFCLFLSEPHLRGPNFFQWRAVSCIQHFLGSSWQCFHNQLWLKPRGHICCTMKWNENICLARNFHCT